ncbi:MAG: hypothetical protein IMZ45_05465 [Actinobacteria bacterium]|nr:hypothetical protein [Actinomycetota bacterium]
MSRRSVSVHHDGKLFSNIHNLLNIKTTTIEPFDNYPDLFITSEVLDCLSYSLSFKEMNIDGQI